MTLHTPPETPGLNDQAADMVLRAIETTTQAHFVISPGGRSAPLAFALGQRDASASTIVLDERQAAFYALGRARHGPQELTTLLCTSGSAGAHYLPAIIEADYSGVALLIITADRPDRLQGVGGAQTIDQRNFFGHHVGQSIHINVDVESLSELPQRVAALVSTAINQQTPVHLNLAFDEPLHLAVVQSDRASAPKAIETHGEFCTSHASNIAKTLEAECQGIIILGPNAVQGTAESEAMICFIRKLGWPCFSHVTAGLSRCLEAGIVEGSIDHWLRIEASQTGAASLIVYFGQAPTSRLLLNYLTHHPQVISFSRGRHAVHPWLHGDSFSGLNAGLLKEITAQLSQGSTTEQARVISHSAAIKNTLSSDETELLWSGQIFRHMLDCLYDQTNILVGNSLPIRDMELFTSRIPKTCSVMANRGVNGIDGHIATASGIAARNTNACTILVCGDLTALHDIGALLLAKDVGLKIIVIDNRGGGVFDQLPFAEDSETFRRFFTTQQATPLAEIGAAYGFEVHQFETLAELDLVTMLNRSGPCLCVISVRTKDARRARATMTREIERALEQKS